MFPTRDMGINDDDFTMTSAMTTSVVKTLGTILHFQLPGHSRLIF